MGDLSQVPPPPEHLAILKDEQELLEAFRIISLDSMPSDHPEKVLAASIVKRPSSQLHSLFKPDGSPLYNLEKETLEEKRLSHLLCSKRTTISENSETTSATVSQASFSARFQEATYGLLEGLDWTNVFVAGGCIMACLVPELEHEWTHADVDMYATVRDENEANRIYEHIRSVITSNAAKKAEERYREVEIVATRRTISIRTAWKVFQVVTTLYDSPLEILIGFDVDAGCVGTMDGKNALSTKRGALAMRKRYNFWMLSLRPTLAIEGRYQRRLLKYSHKGFGVLVSNVDWSKIPMLDDKRPDDLKGIALLALFDRKSLSHSHGPSRSEHHLYASGIEESIHGGDAWCHYCHKKLPQEESDSKTRLSLADPLQWERVNVSRQDFDGGVQIRSFAYLRDVPKTYDEGVYSELEGRKAPLDAKENQEESNQKTVDSTSSNAESTAITTTTPLSSQPGIETPLCYCDLPCKLLMTKKEGPNFRRRFFCCPNSKEDNSCKFFLWEGATMPFDQQRALRLQKTAHIQHLTEGFAEPSLMDTSRQLLAIASCYKSGRLSDQNRMLLKDLVLQSSQESEESPMTPIFTEYADHLDIEELARQLTDYCKTLHIDASQAAQSSN